MFDCPYCGEQWPMSWTQYRQADARNYPCPDCGLPGKLVLPVWLRLGEYALLIGGHLLAAGLGIFLLTRQMTTMGLLVWLGGSLLWLVANIPLNMMLDGVFGRLEPLPGVAPPPLPPEPPPPVNDPESPATF